MKKKYSYNDWYEGKVILIFARRNDMPNPNIVEWDNFSNEEKIKIQEQQKLIFEKLVMDTLKSVQNDFQNDFQRSRSKIDLINKLLKRFTEVFAGKMICDNHYCHTSDTSLTFHFWYYQEMKTYIDYHFIGGQQYDFSNVHSPNSIFWDQNMIMPEVLVESISSMIKLLKSEKNKLKSRVKPTKSILNIQENNTDNKVDNSTTNPYPDIFSSYKAYEFFLELERLTLREKNLTSVYSFIYFKLNEPKIDYPIKKNVSQSQFIDFLVDTKRMDAIYPPKLKKRNPESKQSLFQVCLKKFQSSL